MMHIGYFYICILTTERKALASTKLSELRNKQEASSTEVNWLNQLDFCWSKSTPEVKTFTSLLIVFQSSRRLESASKTLDKHHYSSGLFITLVWHFSLSACPHLFIFVSSPPTSPSLKVEVVAKQPTTQQRCSASWLSARCVPVVSDNQIHKRVCADNVKPWIDLVSKSRSPLGLSDPPSGLRRNIHPGPKKGSNSEED